MHRILFVATLAFAAQAPSWAQQPTVSTEKADLRPESPVIERTESVIYEKRVTEKRLTTSFSTPAPVSASTASLSAEPPVYESQSLGSPSRNGQMVPGSAVFSPADAAPNPDDMRVLRKMIETQNAKIDSIQTDLGQLKGATTAASPNRPSKPGKVLKRDNVSIGIYAGPNFSKYSTDQDSLESKARVGYQLGVYVRGGGRLFGQVGVEYVGVSSKRYSKDDKGTSLDQISSTINTHYVQIPLQIGFRPAMSPSKRTGIRIQAGAELSYLLNADKNDFNLTDDDYNKTVVNLLGGVGFDLGPVTLDVSYHHGIKDVYKAENAKLRMVSASLGFKF
ncbi:porin family protein [Larkinella humicola]|uniref:PorT family protein n=1 Tax=Larkinella humicola TaxID=2607654 RepID=A0A5N1JB61_9BACT|nr:porin family protein [Larkinella humicola]KAA9349014.1 PorT family protein [Larkinella humicola]